MNSYSCQHWHLQNKRLKEPECSGLVLKAIGGNEQLKVEEELIINRIQNFHWGKPWFPTIYNLGAISMVNKMIHIKLATTDNDSASPIGHLSSNGSNPKFQSYLYQGIVNMVSLWEKHSTDFKKYSWSFVWMYSQRWTTRQLTHQWCTYSTTC